MNIDEYERQYWKLYSEFADIVRFILEKAIEADSGLVSRPQSVQCRAKTVASLRARLQENGLIESNAIEGERKDLAGVRLIFYTNRDVERFLSARLIQQNFEVDWDATKVHHPTTENDGLRYQAIHYTVCLGGARTQLSEYAKFSGLRCEIQIQTILNHAWSETSHDIIYKDKPSEGFGSKAMESITNRFNRIMDKYLLPAGHEFQRVQHDYERLRQGKELFDNDALKALTEAKTNNERYERLQSLKDFVLPNYDDLSAIYSDVAEPLIESAKAAVNTPVEPITTPFGEFEGKTADDVILLVVETLEYLRNLDIERTFLSLCDLYEAAQSNTAKGKIIEAVNRLAKYDLHVWQQVGPLVQIALSKAIDGMSAARRLACHSIIVAVWSSILDSEMTGTLWNDESVTLSSGAVPVSKELSDIRNKAMLALFQMFDVASSEPKKRAILTALRHATHLPNQADFSNELLALTLESSRSIVEFLIARPDQPYELLEHLEHELLYDVRRAREIESDDQNRFGCQSLARAMIADTLKFRDIINADTRYVRYKTLVGYETVYPWSWDDSEFDFERVEEHRKSQLELFVDQVTLETQGEWLSLIERCAETESNDLATFPLFGEFLVRLSTAKPEIAESYLAHASERLLRFLPGFLNGLFKSDKAEIYQRVLEQYCSAGAHLHSLAIHWRASKPGRPAMLATILKKAVAQGDKAAVTECVIYAIEENENDGNLSKERFFLPALRFLTDQLDTYWVHRTGWIRPAAQSFFDSLTEQETSAVLANLLNLSRVDHTAERLLGMIAREHSRAVWEYLGQRLYGANEDRQSKARYQEIPFQLPALAKELSGSVAEAVEIAKAWYVNDATLFSCRGARLLAAVFPTFPKTLADQFIHLVQFGTSADADMVLDILLNYNDQQSTHDTLKEIVAKYASEAEKMSKVKAAIDRTGVVWGQLGFVEAYRSKKERIQAWCDDARLDVREFAARHLRDLDRRISSEQKRADEDRFRSDTDKSSD